MFLPSPNRPGNRGLGGLRGLPKVTQPGRRIEELWRDACTPGAKTPLLDRTPTAPQDPFQSPGGRAALPLPASWLVPEPSATAPQSSKIVCVHRCVWWCMHVSCFAFPFSSWQVLHFQSTHWVNFSRFKTIAGRHSAPRSRRGIGHRASGIVWLSWHLCKLP